MYCLVVCAARRYVGTEGLSRLLTRRLSFHLVKTSRVWLRSLEGAASLTIAVSRFNALPHNLQEAKLSEGRLPNLEEFCLLCPRHLGWLNVGGVKLRVATILPHRRMTRASDLDCRSNLHLHRVRGVPVQRRKCPSEQHMTRKSGLADLWR